MPRPTHFWKSQPLLAPRGLRPWLTDNHSLTARIVARCGRFAVRVLEGVRPRPFEDERRLIGLARARRAWTREVLLLADDVPVVLGHSIAAAADLCGPWRLAAGIGGRPLGAALFVDPGIVRGQLQCRCLRAQHPLHRRAEVLLGVALPPLWARRSLFFRAGRPLLVTEVFLPGIERLAPR